MLVLKVKRNGCLMIGDDIKITVVKSDGGGARLGIDAPNHVKVLRGSVYEMLVRAELQDSPITREPDKSNG